MKRYKIIIVISVAILIIFALNIIYAKYVFYKIEKENNELTKSLVLNTEDINRIGALTDFLYKKRDIDIIGCRGGRYNDEIELLAKNKKSRTVIRIDDDIEEKYNELNEILSKYSCVDYIYMDGNSAVIVLQRASDSTGMFQYCKKMAVSFEDDEHVSFDNYRTIPKVPFKESRKENKTVLMRKNPVLEQKITINKVETNIFTIEDEIKYTILVIFME